VPLMLSIYSVCTLYTGIGSSGPKGHLAEIRAVELSPFREKPGICVAVRRPQANGWATRAPRQGL